MAMTGARDAAAGETVVRATTVAHGGRALLLRGPAGAGKSALALQMIALGAALVADDRTVLRAADGVLRAAPPPAIAGLIEARGLGLLRLPHTTDVPVAAVADLGAAETARLPPLRTTALLGHEVALYRRVAGAHVASALLLALSHPPIDPDAAS
jgi:HPr kinase/phosphorylase